MALAGPNPGDISPTVRRLVLEPSSRVRYRNDPLIRVLHRELTDQRNAGTTREPGSGVENRLGGAP